MTDKRWEFDLDGAKHSVELEHNPFSNKLSVRVDGKLQILSPEDRQSKARDIKHAFQINGHACEVVIKVYKKGIEYRFAIDGVSDIPETYAHEIIEAQNNKKEYDSRWVMIGVFLAIGVGGNLINWYFAHTRGFFNGFIALIAPAFTFLAFYFIFFPKDYFLQFAGKFPLRMWVAIILAFLLGFVNLYAFENGLY
jgi:hypothetical protein